MYSTADGSLVKQLSFSANVFTLQFSPDGLQLAVAGDANTVYIYNTVTWVLALSVGPFGGQVSGIAYASDSTWAAVTTQSSVTRIDTVSGTVLNDYTGTPLSVAVSPDDTQLISGSKNNEALVFSASSMITSLTVSCTNDVFSVDWSRDGTKLAGAYGKSMSLWSAADGSVLNTFLHSSDVHSVAFAPNSPQVACAGKDHDVYRLRPSLA